MGEYGKIELFGKTLDLDNLQSAYLHGDCMEGMAKFPDKYFDLAVVDPPYGIKCDGQKGYTGTNSRWSRTNHPFRGWDSDIPPVEYFRELERVSKHQIIWGGGNTSSGILRRGIRDGLCGIRDRET